MFAMRKVSQASGLLPLASAHLPSAASMCYHADTSEDFDAAVNLLTYTMPDDGLLNEVVVSVIFPE